MMSENQQQEAATSFEVSSLAARNEYIDDKLEKAAQIVWLVLHEHDSCGDLGPPPLGWLEVEAAQLRLQLARGNAVFVVEGTKPLEYWRWRALEIMNLPRIVGSSSAGANSNANA